MFDVWKHYFISKRNGDTFGIVKKISFKSIILIIIYTLLISYATDSSKTCQSDIHSPRIYMADFQHGMLVPNTVTHWVCGRLPTGYAGVLPAHAVCVARLPARCAGVKTFTRCNVNATGFKHADFDHLDLYIRRLCVPLNLLFTCIVQRKKLFQFQYWKFAITEHLRFWISRMSGKKYFA